MKMKDPYHLSVVAKEALSNLGAERAAGASTMGEAARLMKTPSVVKTTEEAARVARDLGEVNRKLRAARRSR